MAGAAALLIVSLAAVLVTACVWHNLVARGVWTFVPMSQTFVTYKLPMYLRIFGTPAIIAIMLVALRRDHRRRLERDWIHRAGVLVAIALGSLDVGQNIWALSQW
jgi:hypothetical protein